MQKAVLRASNARMRDGYHFPDFVAFQGLAACMTEIGEVAANSMKADAGIPDPVAGVDAAHSEGAGEPQAGCPACGALASRALFTASDRLYGLTDKEFRIVECVGCRLIRLFPPPTSNELRGYYPEDYWFAPQADTVDRLQEWYRRLVLRDHIRFVRRVIQDLSLIHI